MRQAITMLTVGAALAISAWCGGAYDPQKGTNFGPCDGHVSPGQGSIQSPGDAAGAAAASASAASASASASSSSSSSSCK